MMQIWKMIYYLPPFFVPKFTSNNDGNFLKPDLSWVLEIYYHAIYQVFEIFVNLLAVYRIHVIEDDNSIFHEKDQVLFRNYEFKKVWFVITGAYSRTCSSSEWVQAFAVFAISHDYVIATAISTIPVANIIVCDVVTQTIA